MVDLKIASVNYNTADFLILTIHALKKLTKNSWELYILDNGSNPEDILKLRDEVAKHKNIHLLLHKQQTFGSAGHAEGLNYLLPFLDAKYSAIIDADCTPLIKDWDQILIDQLNDKVKIAGTPVCVAKSTLNANLAHKPSDFPLVFLVMFDTTFFKSIGIDFMPGENSSSKDVGWVIREKFTESGASGYVLHASSTRDYPDGPFANLVCAEYYTDDSKKKIFCSHFGRGSNPLSHRFRKNFIGRFFSNNIYEKEKRKWIGKCECLINEI